VEHVDKKRREKKSLNAKAVQNSNSSTSLIGYFKEAMIKASRRSHRNNSYLIT